MTAYEFLTDGQFVSEAERCFFCEDKPCRQGCPVNCSPADFILSAKGREPEDFRRSAAEIMTMNPLGGICGVICPDTYCQAMCTHKTFGDGPIEIPKMQAYVVAKAKELGVMPKLAKAESNGKKIAVVGSGPAGLAAAATLAQRGYETTIFEREARTGGALRLIPEGRLPTRVLDSDIEWILDATGVKVVCNHNVEDVEALAKDFDAVIVTTGLHNPVRLGIPGEDLAMYGNAFLKSDVKLSGHAVVVGGGAIAVDCALTALERGASGVEMIALEKFNELPLTPNERKHIFDAGIELTGRTKVTEIINIEGKAVGIKTARVKLNGDKFSLRDIADVPGSEQIRHDVKNVIIAIGNRPLHKAGTHDRIFYAGDGWGGPSTAVECSASGKNIADHVDKILKTESSEAPLPVHPIKSCIEVEGYNYHPVSLETDFFGRKLINPFLLSAAPPSDGYDQMKRALDAGWAGGFMKTTFDDVEIHIPAGYMFAPDKNTFGNCDNVSEHPLKRVAREIRQLVKEYPDRLIAVSTGGPVTGDDEHDRAGWQSNTRKLEEAGAMAIEYSLSCPQGGDGTEGDIVSQNPELTAKIIDWIMQVSAPDVPKLFKLTGAVTSIAKILIAIKEVLDRYPEKKAGVTLANTFPSLTFRKHTDGKEHDWDEGVLIGLSGHGVTPISNLSLHAARNLGLTISGNGGPMNYRDAANFLALGTNTVQFCTIAMKHGVGIIDYLTQGLSHFMAEKGIESVDRLIGRAKNSVTDFMSLSPVKMIPQVNEDHCIRCGNCSRCSYFGITMDPQTKLPVMHADVCVGCTICVQKCPSLALRMRPRRKDEIYVAIND